MNWYIDDQVMCVECGYRHRYHATSCTRQISPEEWWRRAKETADAYVAAHSIRPYGYRMDARSEAMCHIISLARKHPRARELLQLISDAGWNI